jgi:hypothetical protein
MQSLTLASQNSVQPQDMGVATSSATFFRQIGGTLGTAVLLSVLFAVMPLNITTAMTNKADLTSALDAALTPSVANSPANGGIMQQLWNPIVTPVKTQMQASLDQGTTAAKQAADQAVTQQVTTAVQQQVAAGRVPAAAAQSIIDQQVAAAKPAAEQQALSVAAQKAGASVVDGKLAVDFSDQAQRSAVVDKLVPTMIDQLNSAKSNGSSSSSSATSDTSYLKGADARLTRPFMVGFNSSAVSIYWVGLGVIILAFILAWFFKTPPLRQRSALQEQADRQQTAEDLEVYVATAAAETGAQAAPATGTIRVHRP